MAKINSMNWQPISEAPKDKILLTNEGTAIWDTDLRWCLCDAGGCIPLCADWGKEISQIEPTHFILWEDL